MWQAKQNPLKLSLLSQTGALEHSLRKRQPVALAEATEGLPRTLEWVSAFHAPVPKERSLSALLVE